VTIFEVIILCERKTPRSLYILFAVAFIPVIPAMIGSVPFDSVVRLARKLLF
jgi:hypothetical protein